MTARTPQALQDAAGRWAEHLDLAAPEDFYDIAYTACRRRGLHEHRMAVLAGTPAQAALALRSLAGGDPLPDAVRAEAAKQGWTAFVFAGNGSPCPGMGAALLAEDQAFAHEVAAVDGILRPMLGWSVLAELSDPAAGRWQRIEFLQPLLFAVQVGLVAALANRGVRPEVVVGHSVGEIAAAHCCGALDLRSACQVLVDRSMAQAGRAGSGRIAAMGLGESEALELVAEAGCQESVSVAAVNTARDVTVSGDATALCEIGEVARQRGVFFRDLGLVCPFHSPAVDPLRTRLLTSLAFLRTGPGQIPMISTVTGGAVPGPDLGPDYWWHNLRRPVRFADAIRAAGHEGYDVLVEIGPHPVLGTYLRRNTAEAGGRNAIIPTISRTVPGAGALDEARMRVLASGGTMDWDVLFPHRGRVVTLPAYQWQRERHWNGAPDWWLEGVSHGGDRTANPLPGSRTDGPNPGWSAELVGDSRTWLADHVVDDAVCRSQSGSQRLPQSKSSITSHPPGRGQPINRSSTDRRSGRRSSTNRAWIRSNGSSGRMSWTTSWRRKVRFVRASSPRIQLSSMSVTRTDPSGPTRSDSQPARPPPAANFPASPARTDSGPGQPSPAGLIVGRPQRPNLASDSTAALSSK